MATLTDDPALYIFTSLTAGSSHIVTATSRLETILRANRVPFKAIDIATDQKARMLWGRRAGKDGNGRVRKLPGLVQEGMVLGDIVEIEEWNEYHELKQHLKIYYDENTIPNINNKYPPPKMRRPYGVGAPVKKPAGSAAAAAGAAAAAAAAASAASSSSTPAPSAGTPAPPPPGPAPAPKKTNPVVLKASEGKQETLPVRSVADEAAAKAKEMRLKSLREKVHGKKAAEPSAESKEKKEDKEVKDDKDEKKAEDEKEKEDEEKEEKEDETTEDHKNIGLQSPTSGKRKSDESASAKTGDVQSPESTGKNAKVVDSSPIASKGVEAKDGTKEEDDDDDDEDEDEDTEDSEDSEEDEDTDDDDEDEEEDEKKDAAVKDTPAEAAKADEKVEEIAKKDDDKKDDKKDKKKDKKSHDKKDKKHHHDKKDKKEKKDKDKDKEKEKDKKSHDKKSHSKGHDKSHDKKSHSKTHDKSHDKKTHDKKSHDKKDKEESKHPKTEEAAESSSK
ncbi:unnamed protein product [Clonostachys byssicola]|uniref:Cylicin I n=1 Tax=Clonostachys byssicola TaxID=160290 RepID=A0A9N9XVT2_9HYPO|nr:unnamed protein product [Clonostachys byssicola]